MKLKRSEAPWAVYPLSFLVPAAVMVAVCIALGIYPFGGKTLLISDMSNQYVSYLSYFRALMTGSSDVFYTFSKSLGGDMVSVLAYYLLSPFNLITLLFSAEGLPLAVDIIIISKIAACGLTFGIYLNRTYGKRWMTLLFSSAYALMAYNIAFCFNIMWLDGVILLPLIILGINNIFEKRSALCYLFSLFAALVTDYYIGFMLCIFSVLYFLYKFVLSLSRGGFPQSLKMMVPYALSSFGAAGLAAVLLVPAFCALQGSKAMFSLESLTFTANYPFPDVFSKLFTSAFNWDQEVNGLPNIFCGIPVVVLSIQYFLNSGIRLRERICSAALLGVLFASFHVNMFNLVWHGLNPPSWFPYRYSFLFSFLLIAFAYRNFMSLTTINARHIILGALIFLTCAVFVQYRGLDFLSLGYIYLDILLCLLTCALVYAYTRVLRRSPQKLSPPIDPAFSPVPVIRRTRNKTFIILAAALALLQIGDLGLNAYHTIGKLNEVFCEDVSYFRDFALYTGQVVNSVKLSDPGLYRMEKTFRYSLNDSMLFDYKGMTHFSSTEKEFVKMFIGTLGFRNNGNWVCYNNGSTAAADALLGVKYMLTQSETSKPYDEILSQNDILVYQNPYAFPLGFTASASAKDVDIYGCNFFENQNHIFRSLVTEDCGAIFSPAETADISCVNVSEQQQDGFVLYTKLDESQDAYVEYKVQAASSGELFGYLYAPDLQGAELFVNDVSAGYYFDWSRWDIFPLGNFAPDEMVSLKIKLTGNELRLSGADFYHEDTAALERYYNALSGGFCDLKEISSSHLQGSVTVEGENKLLVFSIPYERGWSVYIDGAPAETSSVFYTFLSVPISSGQHSIELRYTPGGLYIGLAVSGASLFFVLVYISCLIAIKRRQNKKKISISF